MNRFGLMIVVTLALAASQTADAQVYQVYYAAPTTAYYQPAPVTTAYYAPSTVYYAAPPTTAYYAPATTYYAPVPTTTYYAPAAPVVTTYYRPILGGTISRVRYNYAPVTYAYPTTVAYYPAW